ncbi:MAG: DUF302 domain-containing protein [Rhodoglobus sp.]
MTYAHTVTLAIPFEEAVTRTRELLAEQGFGVLTEIDIHATFGAKLGAESAAAVGDYVILGACNPTLSERSITAEPTIGVLLPCNVVVRRAPGATETTVQTIDPQTMVQLTGSPKIKEVADEVDSRLRKVLAGLAPSAA